MSGGYGRGGVEERREVAGAHVAALEVGDRVGVGDAVAEEAGSALGPERDRDHGWECLVAGELARAIDGISDSVLSDRLSDLAAAGLITRTVDDGPPLAVSYALTDRGKALLPALEQITLWAQEHLVEDPT